VLFRSLSGCFSKDGEYLATGSQGGQIKVWKLSSGVCLRKFNQAHTQGITSIQFTKDGLQLLTTSFDGTARIHGLKSGKTLKEFRGHTSYVNGAIFTADNNNIITISSDGTAKFWDVRTSDLLQTTRPGQNAGASILEKSLTGIMMLPNDTDHFIVCSKGPQAFLMSSQGLLLRIYSSGKTSGGDFVCFTVSPQGKWLYCVGEDGIMYVFEVQNGQLENTVQVNDNSSEIIGICHHPHRNLVAVIDDRGQLKLWKS